MNMCSWNAHGTRYSCAQMSICFIKLFSF